MKLPKVSCHQKKKVETSISWAQSESFQGMLSYTWLSWFHQTNSIKRRNAPFPHLAVFTGPKCTPWADRALLKSAHGIVVEKSFPWERWFIILPKGLESWQQLRGNFRNQKLALKHVHSETGISGAWDGPLGSRIIIRTSQTLEQAPRASFFLSY